MTANEFRRDMTSDGVEVKRTAFLAQLTMKYDLEQHIAQFLNHLLVIPGFDSIQQFINFFDSVPA